MSYSFNYPCYNCKKETECKDKDKIQKAISEEIHMSNDGTHKGSGTIMMMCAKVQPKSE